MAFLRYVLLFVTIGYGNIRACSIDHSDNGESEYLSLFRLKSSPKPNQNLNKKLYELIDDIHPKANYINNYGFVDTSILDTIERYSTSKLLNVFYFVTHKELNSIDSQIISLEYINEYPMLTLSDQNITQIYITSNGKYYDFIFSNGTHVMGGFSVLQSYTWKVDKYDYKLKVHYAPGYIGGFNLGEPTKGDVDITITTFYKILKFSADVRLYKSEGNSIRIANVKLEHNEQFGNLMYIISSIFHGIYLFCGLMILITILAPLEKQRRFTDKPSYTVYNFVAFSIIFTMAQVLSKIFYDALQYYFSFGFSGVLNGILLVEVFLIYGYFVIIIFMIPIIFEFMGVATFVFNFGYFGIWFILHLFGFADYYEFLNIFTSNPNIYFALLSGYALMIPMGAIYSSGIWSGLYWSNLAITAYGLIYPMLDFGSAHYTQGFYKNAWIYILVNIVTSIILKIQSSYGSRFFLSNNQRVTLMDTWTKELDITEFEMRCDIGLNMLSEDSPIYLQYKPKHLIKVLKPGQYYNLTCNHKFHYNCLATIEIAERYFNCPIGKQYHENDMYFD